MALSFKNLARRAATATIPATSTLPILAGPAKGLRVPKKIAIAYPSLILGTYERAISNALLASKRPIEVAYDVGAHVGLTSLVLARVSGRSATVLAFEPAHENVALLTSLIAANPGIDIRIFPIALSDTVDQVEFCHYQGSSMGLLRTIAFEDGTDVLDIEREVVRTTTVDTIVFEQKQPVPDLIKIDVEGAERLVLAGSQETIKRYHPTFLIELHGPLHAANVFDQLAPFPYSWTYIEPEVGPGERIVDRSQLLKYFGRDDKWTQHVLLQ
jgi:FkbM family methyltransferase